MKNIARTLIAAALVAVAAAAVAGGGDGTAKGLVALKSPHEPGATMDRLDAAVRERGLQVFARIDHAAGAAQVGLPLRPTALLVFGHPKGGTPLMECAQTAGIDLPLKALVWQDASGQVWLGYNDPAYLAQRHGAADCAAVGGLQKGLAGLAQAVVAR